MRKSILNFSLMIFLFLCLPGYCELSKQVLINVEFWEITYSDELEHGVEYRWNREAGDLYDSSLYLPGPSSNPVSEISNLSANILDVHYGNLGIMIRVGIFENRARILSNPKIIVIDGQEAYFNTGDSVPYTSRNESTNNLITQFYDTGVKLTVVPTIRKDNFVELSVAPEFSIITDYVPGEEVSSDADDSNPNYELPIIAERKATTNLLVKSGSKFILGGLLSENNINTTWKVPIMGFHTCAWTSVLQQIR